MLYGLYQAYADTMLPVRTAARISAGTLKSLPFGLADQPHRALDVGGAGGLRRHGPQPHPTALRDHRHAHHDRRRRRDRGGRRLDAVRHAAAVPEGHRRPGPTRADPRSALGALRDAADRHRRDDVARPRRVHHRLAQRPGRGPRRGPLRARRVRRPRRALPRRARPRARTCSRCASRACRRCRHRGDGRERRPVRAPDADPDGRADRHPHQPDRGQRPGDDRPDRVVRAERHQHGAAGASRVPVGGSTPASSSSPLHLDEPRPAHREPLSRCTRTSSTATSRGGRHPRVLRRVLRGARPDRRVLPGDRRAGVPDQELPGASCRSTGARSTRRRSAAPCC